MVIDATLKVAILIGIMAATIKFVMAVKTVKYGGFKARVMVKQDFYFKLDFNLNFVN